MPISLKEDIQNGLVAKLQKITTANGYDTDVQNVYADDIPMGLDLYDSDLPAILLVGGDDEQERSMQWVKGLWNLEIQLIHKQVADGVMHRFVRDVAKAIFADSPTAQRNEAWRGPQPGGIHESVYDIWQRNIESDLNMIEANRFFCVNYVLRYQTRPHNL